VNPKFNLWFRSLYSKSIQRISTKLGFEEKKVELKLQIQILINGNQNEIWANYQNLNFD
jgi:hypothetical protein